MLIENQMNYLRDIAELIVDALENYDEGSAELHYDELVEIWEYYKKL